MYRRGFTLIELLVVIAIIGILAGIVLVALNSSSAKGRDARRLEDIHNFETALELYYDTNGHYPYTNCSSGQASGHWTSFDSPSYSVDDTCDTQGGPGVQPLTQTMAPYIGALQDPRSLGGGSGYLYLNTGGANDYCILFWRTPENMNDFPASFTDPARCTAWDSAGSCTTPAGMSNAIYAGAGAYAAGGC